MMTGKADRRQVVAGGLATGWAAGWAALAAGVLPAMGAGPGVTFGPAMPFSFDGLKERARAAAATAWVKAEPADADTLQKIDYDAYQKIRFRPELSLQIDRGGQAPVQLFHLGKYFMEPVRIHVLREGEAREVLYSPDLFDIPAGHPARNLPNGVGFAGFRVMAPDLATDWLAALGASYYRTSGPYNQYGLSARGLAIDTAMPHPEEFPRFAEIWLKEADSSVASLAYYALLDGPSVTGAYQFRFERLTDGRGIHRIVTEVEATLFARKNIRRLGIAPFSSMFWYGEHSRNQAVDWRPEIHDSDGLSILTGAGERIWRPLINPPRVMTSSFVDRDPKGFGLLQRDRDFVHYLDDGVFYERRPSVWVEPLDPWGPGAVQLVEIPTDDETHDNIVAYWTPEGPLPQGETRTFRYRLTWLDDVPFPDSLGRATATWTGVGGIPGHKPPPGVRKFVIDWQGPVFAGLSRTDGVEIVVSTSRGEVSNAYTHPVVDQRERWRALFDVTALGSEPVDMRAYLKRGGQALTETWIFQYFPEG